MIGRTLSTPQTDVKSEQVGQTAPRGPSQIQQHLDPDSKRHTRLLLLFTLHFVISLASIPQQEPDLFTNVSQGKHCTGGGEQIPSRDWLLLPRTPTRNSQQLTTFIPVRECMCEHS